MAVSEESFFGVDVTTVANQVVETLLAEIATARQANADAKPLEVKVVLSNQANVMIFVI